jgi:hypothetical protein
MAVVEIGVNVLTSFGISSANNALFRTEDVLHLPFLSFLFLHLIVSHVVLLIELCE